MRQPAVRAPEFPEPLDWIHTEGERLRLAALRGKIVLLDFWTYGCINCMHVIPQLRELEMAYGHELVMIGVHSGKYTTERITDRIREASLRLGVTHPIVNDRHFRIWRSFAVSAWPTIVVIDPRGYILGQHAGELTAEQIAPFLENIIAASLQKKELSVGTIGFSPEVSHTSPGTLLYPGKVVLDHELGHEVRRESAHGRRMAIADTGHHRVLVGRLNDAGTTVMIERIIGTGVSGFSDGVGGSLSAPQGMVFRGDTLYVADTDNHAIRSVDLTTGELRTICGTGDQLRSGRDDASGRLSSPWDLTMVGETLYVAMAGTHQLYAVDLPPGSSGPVPPRVRTRVHSGSRHENLVDAPHAEAMLAQPMAITADGQRLYFADAESSAIRVADVDPAGEVRTIVGAGLFDFGDRDGVGEEVRLQHPQGIARHESGALLIADTYNDALKWVDPATRAVTTWVRGLHEPNGVACGPRMAYVADTNAHRIVAIDYETGVFTPVEVDVHFQHPASLS